MFLDLDRHSINRRVDFPIGVLGKHTKIKQLKIQPSENK